MDEYKQANKALWNAWTDIHEKSEFYDLAGFKAGKTSLKAIELEELGEVRDKSLLHLQCNFGMDTLSWARLGAKVTGVDFSDRAIELARSLNDELGLTGRFLCSDINELPKNLSGQFDIVFTSYGVLSWLKDLLRWAQVIFHFLKPGGVFYMVEIHPFTNPLDDSVEGPELRFHYPYFHSPVPEIFEAQTSYADPLNKHTDPLINYQWFHSLSDVLNALIMAGMNIEFLHEYPYCVFQLLPFMLKDSLGWWHLPEDMPKLPLTFSLMAKK